jgi:hypothetical protein
LGEEKILNKKDFLVLNKISEHTKRELASLKRHFLIKAKKEKNGSVSVYLTQEGFLEFLKLLIIESDNLPEGEVTIVVFDVPEEFRKQRDLLSRFFENGAFFRIQKSVWICPFDCADILDVLFYCFGIKKWTKIYLAKEREKFKLLSDRLKERKNR